MNKTKIDIRKYFKSSSLATTTALATPTVTEQSNESTVNNTSIQFLTNAEVNEPAQRTEAISTTISISTSTTSTSNPEINLNVKSKNTDSIDDLGKLSSGPVQPILANYPKSKFGNKYRGFQSSYFQEYDGLEYSISRNAVFCYYCRMFPSFSMYREDNFVTTGVTNWKHIRNILKTHWACNSHLESTQRFINYQLTLDIGTIHEQSDSGFKKIVMENNIYLEKIIKILLFLAKQGISFRGHLESVDSNNKGTFRELCNLLALYDSEFKKKLEGKFNYNSPDIQNELLNICATQIRKQIVNEIIDAGFYTLMVDEAKLHKTEQLSICLRYCINLQTVERFLCFIDCSSNRKAESLYNIIKVTLSELGIYNIPIIAQCYDGANVMSGNISGLKTLIINDHPNAEYVHCMAHKLNLVLVYACTKQPLAKLFFDTMQSLYCIFAEPNSHEILIKVQSNLQITHEIPSLSETRWSYRYRAVKAVYENIEEILEALNIIQSNGGSQRMAARGLIATIADPEFIYCLIIFNKILPLIHVAHKTLQSEENTLADAKSTLTCLREELDRLKSDLEWNEISNEYTSRFVQNNDTSINKPKRMRTATSFNDFVCYSLPNLDLNYTPIIDYRTTLYYSILDLLIEELDRRFNKITLSLADSVASLLKGDFSTLKIQHLTKYCTTLNIDYNLAIAEFKLIKHSLLFSTNQNDAINQISKSAYPNAFKLIKLSKSLPIGSSECERSFSAIRRISSYLRTSMAQQRLSNLGILNIEKSLVDLLNVEDVIKEFVNSKLRRLSLI